MFSYSFAVKLTDRKISDCPPALFKSEPHEIKVEREESDVFLVSSAGYASEAEALQQLVTMLMKTKITLLNLRIPHLDWLSFDSTQRFATDAIGSLFERKGIVAISYRPQAYETKKISYWPGAMPAASALDLESLKDLSPRRRIPLRYRTDSGGLECSEYCLGGSACEIETYSCNDRGRGTYRQGKSGRSPFGCA